MQKAVFLPVQTGKADSLLHEGLLDFKNGEHFGVFYIPLLFYERFRCPSGQEPHQSQTSACPNGIVGMLRRRVTQCTSLIQIGHLTLQVLRHQLWMSQNTIFFESFYTTPTLFLSIWHLSKNNN